MGRAGKAKQKAKQNAAEPQPQIKPERYQWELLKTIGDLNVKENWDKFYTRRGERTFERYADWGQLEEYLKPSLKPCLSEKKPSPEETRILVPACGNSRLSQDLYDAEFLDITSVDFSTVLIEKMSKNQQLGMGMKWEVMDITRMTFADGDFDAVVDKGGLDNLMESDEATLGDLYIKEVKRVLKSGGKYYCITSLEKKILDVLFPAFRFGWNMSICAIQMQSEDSPKIFLVVAQKNHPIGMTDVSPLELRSVGNKGAELERLIKKEREIRHDFLTKGKDAWYTLDDLRNGLRETTTTYKPGRRIKLKFDDQPGMFNISKGLLLDTQRYSGDLIYHYIAFIVPKVKEREWLYSTEEGQWCLAEGAKTARLLLVYLDSSLNDDYKGLTLVSNQLAPGYCHPYEIHLVPFVMAENDGAKREFVHQAVSDLNGRMVVEDVIYNLYADRLFRYISLVKNENRVQYEACLLSEEQRVCYGGGKKVRPNFLTSNYHNAVISGMLLFSLYFNSGDAESYISGEASKAVVLGIGAGLLPLFMKFIRRTLKIEVVEADPIFVDVTKNHFDFEEDELLKVHTTDEIGFVKDLPSLEKNIDILVVDVGSFDISSGLACPRESFVAESFMLAAKDSLSEKGVFVFNLISKAATVRARVHSCLKRVFSNVFRLWLADDENEVIFALKLDAPIMETKLSEARTELEMNLEKVKGAWKRPVSDLSKKIELLGE